jgi:hypothetical protein
LLKKGRKEGRKERIEGGREERRKGGRGRKEGRKGGRKDLPTSHTQTCNHLCHYFAV